MSSSFDGMGSRTKKLPCASLYERRISMSRSFSSISHPSSSTDFGCRYLRCLNMILSSTRVRVLANRVTP